MAEQERSEEIRRLVWRHAPALAIEAGWEDPDKPKKVTCGHGTPKGSYCGWCRDWV